MKMIYFYNIPTDNIIDANMHIYFIDKSNLKRDSEDYLLRK